MNNQMECPCILHLHGYREGRRSLHQTDVVANRDLLQVMVKL